MNQHNIYSLGNSPIVFVRNTLAFKRYIVLPICVVLGIVFAKYASDTQAISGYATPGGASERAWSAVNETTQSQSKQPHILFFLVDDLGWNDVGMYILL